MNTTLSIPAVIPLTRLAKLVGKTPSAIYQGAERGELNLYKTGYNMYVVCNEKLLTYLERRVKSYPPILTPGGIPIVMEVPTLEWIRSHSTSFSDSSLDTSQEDSSTDSSSEPPSHMSAHTILESQTNGR